jgi:RNA polymerase sigma factor (sigma-70 family)
LLVEHGVSPTPSLTDTRADAELISAVRGGDTAAYGELYARHCDAAHRLARQLVRGGDTDDLVSEAFAKVLVVLQRGGGPDLAFRAYLLTSVRRLHVDRIRQTRRLHTTDDLTPFDPGVPFRDTAVEGFESGAAARAFASLPERWQLVLWHTEVEGQKPAEVAPLLGISANSVAALAYRAREGLREAFLSMHVQDLDDADCEWTHQHLGAFVRGGLSKRDSAKVRAHLNECRRCTAIYVELTDVNAGLAALLGPLVLGSAAAAYLHGTTPVHVIALPLLHRARDLVAGHVPASIASGVAASVVLGSVFVVGLHHDGPRQGGSATTATTKVADVPVQQRAVASPPAFRRTLRPSGQHPSRPAAGTAPAPAQAPAPAPANAPAAATPPSGAGPSSSPSQPAGVSHHPGGTGSGDPGGQGQGGQPSSSGSDLGVRVSVTQHGQGSYQLTATVTGASIDHRGTLRIGTSTGSALVVHDARCSGGPSSAVCTVSSSPTTIALQANAPHAGAVTFTLTPAGGLVDADPTNNIVVVALT